MTRSYEPPLADVVAPNDPSWYRTVLGRVPTSVAIVAGISEGQPIGVAIGSFTSVSLDPPLVGFFITATSTTWPVIVATGAFCVSVLSDVQTDVCRTFTKSGADRFAGCSWSQSASGRPIIDGSVAWMDCTIHSITPAGDHQLVLGAVVEMGISEGVSPLVFLGGDYGSFASRDGMSGQGWA